jgi:hypothetical protein
MKGCGRMSVVAPTLKKVSKKISKQKGVATMKKLTIQEIEKELGFDKVQPIALTPSDTKEFEEKNDPFRKWYEDELHKFYENL